MPTQPNLNHALDLDDVGDLPPPAPPAPRPKARSAPAKARVAPEDVNDAPMYSGGELGRIVRAGQSASSPSPAGRTVTGITTTKSLGESSLARCSRCGRDSDVMRVGANSGESLCASCAAPGALTLITVETPDRCPTCQRELASRPI